MKIVQTAVLSLKGSHRAHQILLQSEDFEMRGVAIRYENETKVRAMVYL